MLTTPAPGSQFTDTTVTFVWTAGTQSSAYWLDMGSVPGGNQYYQSGNLGNVTTTTANGLPSDGSTVYATLYSMVGGQWVASSYTFTAYNLGGGLAVMQTPTPGSTLSGNVASFTWSAGNGATAYWMDIGSEAGGNEYYQSGNLGNVLTTTVDTLPADGTPIYVTLYSYIGGQWLSNSYTYVSAHKSSCSISWRFRYGLRSVPFLLAQQVGNSCSARAPPIHYLRRNLLKGRTACRTYRSLCFKAVPPIRSARPRIASPK